MPLFWKPHLAKNFIEGRTPAENNGVGIGGHLFRSLPNPGLYEHYWVAPVILEEDEYAGFDPTYVESKIVKMSEAPFMPIEEARKLVMVLNPISAENITDNEYDILADAVGHADGPWDLITILKNNGLGIVRIK